MKIPDPRRPSLSGYVQPGRLLPWQWVEQRLVRAPAYWIATRTRGFPSSLPVWGLWQNQQLWFSSGSMAKRIARDGRVRFNLESATEVVIVEGLAGGLDAEQVDTWVRAYREKYNWDMPATTEDVFQVRPRRVLAWICDNTGLDAGTLFSNTATEWRFDE